MNGAGNSGDVQGGWMRVFSISTVLAMALSFSCQASPDCSFTALFAGDAMAHDSVQKMSAASPEGYGAMVHPKISEAISKRNVSFVNVETPLGAQRTAAGKTLSDRGMVWSEGRGPYSGYPMFNAHKSMAQGLARAGFKVAQAANNHALDRGSHGVVSTLASLRDAGLKAHGARSAGGDPFPSVTVEAGSCGGVPVSIGVVSCSFGTNGISDGEGRVPLCHGKGGEEVLAEISRLSETTDAVLFLPHWGDEYSRVSSAAQRDLAKRAVSAGALVIAGTHPHVLQETSSMVAKNGSQAAVAYSLGNFFSGQGGVDRSSAALMSAKVSKVGGRWVASATYLPIVANMGRFPGYPSRTAVPLCSGRKGDGEYLRSVERSVPSEMLSFEMCD